MQMTEREPYEDQARQAGATPRITISDATAVVATPHSLTVILLFQVQNVVPQATSAIINLLDRAQETAIFQRPMDINERQKKSHLMTSRVKEQMTSEHRSLALSEQAATAVAPCRGASDKCTPLSPKAASSAGPWQATPSSAASSPS